MPTRPAPKALQKKFMRSFFGRTITALYPRGTRVLDVTIHRHGHLLFKQAISYVLSLRKPNGTTATRIIRGNVPSADTAPALAIGTTVQKKLYHHGFAFGQYRVPLSLGFFPALRLTLYENFPGTPMALLLNNKALGRRAAIQAGHWLARLHQSPMKVPATRGAVQVHTDAGYFIDNFRRYYPSELGTIRAIMAVLEQRLQKQLRRGRFTLVHGDFHPANIIVHRGGAVGVIDFSNSAVSDPLSDVGSFLAQTDRFVWDNQISSAAASRSKQAFLQAYCRATKKSYYKIKPIIDLYYCWWIVQILAYSIVVRPPAVRKRLVAHGLRAINTTLRRHGLSPQHVDLSTITRDATLRAQLTNIDTMLDFFSANRAMLDPRMDHIEQITIKQPSALSQTSFLTRTTISYYDTAGAAHTMQVRGNFVPRITYQSLKKLATDPKLPILKPGIYLPRLSYLFYREVPGDRFREHSPRQRAYRQYIKSIATTVAQLHREPAVGEPWSQAKERSFIRSRLVVIKQRDRTHARAATKLAQHLLTALDDHWAPQPVTTHGDLQGSNILIGPDKRAWLIDFTLAKKFHPAHDVGTFLSHLDIMLYFQTSEASRARLRHLFLTQYYKKVGRRIATRVARDLEYHRGRAALDIIAITVTNLGPRDHSRDEYVEYLLRQHNLPLHPHV